MALAKTRQMTTEEKVAHMLDGDVMTTVVAADSDELETIREALEAERYQDTTMRWIEGERTLQRGSRSMDPAEMRRRLAAWDDGGSELECPECGAPVSIAGERCQSCR